MCDNAENYFQNLKDNLNKIKSSSKKMGEAQATKTLNFHQHS